jgi:hypothetical protein
VPFVSKNSPQAHPRKSAQSADQNRNPPPRRRGGKCGRLQISSFCGKITFVVNDEILDIKEQILKVVPDCEKIFLFGS